MTKSNAKNSTKKRKPPRKTADNKPFESNYVQLASITNLNESNSSESLVISHYTLRKIIGILGISLPFIVVITNLWFGADGIRTSISAYYHSNMQDYFVGVLFAMGFFLIAYRGYEAMDNRICTTIGMCGFGIAIFPTKGDSGTPVGIFALPPTISFVLHLVCAVSFFLLLAYLSLFIFTKSDKDPSQQTEQKQMRNHSYRFCGGGVLIATIGIVISALCLPEWIQDRLYPVLIFETIALIFFGIAWLVKGETILKDIS